MEENQKEIKEAETTPVVTEETGIQPSTDQEVNKIEADTERINRVVAEHENAKARAKLGGTTLGTEEPKEKKEETAAEYADRVMAGEV